MLGESVLLRKVFVTYQGIDHEDMLKAVEESSSKKSEMFQLAVMFKPFRIPPPFVVKGRPKLKHEYPSVVHCLWDNLMEKWNVVFEIQIPEGTALFITDMLKLMDDYTNESLTVTMDESDIDLEDDAT